MRQVIVTAVAIALWGTGAAAQSLADKDWVLRAPTVASLAVMIDGGEDDICRGSGFIVGLQGSKVYVLTAEHVLSELRDEGTLAALGVRAKFDRPFATQPAVERRVAARVFESNADADLAALEIDDVDFAEMARTRLDWQQAGDSAHLVPDDPAFAIGCAEGLDFDIPNSLTRITAPLPGDRPGVIRFARDYVRQGYSGGPLVHVFDRTMTIVGMILKVGDSAGGAAALADVLERARSWKVPVQLTAPATRADCDYAVSSTEIDLTGEMRLAELFVKTTAGCPWSVLSHTDPELAERQGYWLEVAGPDGQAEGPRRYTGPGRILFTAGPASPCDNVPDRAVARIAGQMIQIRYDGRCDSPAPPSRVQRNPQFARPPGFASPPRIPRAEASRTTTPGGAPASVDGSAAAIRAARDAIIGMGNDGTPAAIGWGCTVYGCRFFEGLTAAFCQPAVTRVELGESPDAFSFDVDRTPCEGRGTQRVLCEDAPHLPFAVRPGRTLYARVHFADGSTMVKPLPISDAALREAVVGTPFSPLGAFDNWTVLEPVPQPGRGPAPFAAIAYQPMSMESANLSGYYLFVGLRGCEGRNTVVSPVAWFSDEGGRGLVPRRQAIGSSPGYGRSMNRVTAAEFAQMKSAPVELSIAADTTGQGRLGPFVYRFDPKAPLVTAVSKAGPPAVRCVRLGTGSLRSCSPSMSLAWLRTKAVRFGPKDGDWQTELAFDALSGAPVGSPQGATPSPREFWFQVPVDWPAIFYQIIPEDGRPSPGQEIKLSEPR